MKKDYKEHLNEQILLIVEKIENEIARYILYCEKLNIKESIYGAKLTEIFNNFGFSISRKENNICADYGVVEEIELDLKPFDKVLTWNCDSETWEIDLFGRIDSDSEKFKKYICLECRCHEIARYKGNEKYLGTADNIPGSWK